MTELPKVGSVRKAAEGSDVRLDAKAVGKRGRYFFENDPHGGEFYPGEQLALLIIGEVFESSRISHKFVFLSFYFLLVCFFQAGWWQGCRMKKKLKKPVPVG